jgi:fimbrial chaperone protein
VPVFVEPLAPPTPQVAWSASRGADGQLSLSARNDGSAHARILGFSVKTADGASTVLDQPGLAYVLPGSTRHWTFDDNNNTRPNAQSTTSSGIAGSYRLEGTTDRGSFVTELQLTD